MLTAQAYAEFRASTRPPAASFTNWTEAYNLDEDPWQQHNVALAGGLAPAVLKDLGTRLWSVATCFGHDCP